MVESTLLAHPGHRPQRRARRPAGSGLPLWGRRSACGDDLVEEEVGAIGSLPMSDLQPRPLDNLTRVRPGSAMPASGI